MPVHPDAQPVLLEGDGTAVLLVHGFTGSPKSLRPWAEHLHAAGHTVSVPLLPGHGTTWQDMNTTTLDDWFAATTAAFDALRARADRVFVGGLSMGGALALRLAEEHGAHVAGLVLVNPAVCVDDIRLRALPVLKHLVPAMPGIANDIRRPGQDEGAYDRNPLRALHSQVSAWPSLIADLRHVDQPLLLFRSRVDHVVPATSSATVLEGVSSIDVTEVVLEDSYHVATLDNDAPTIFEGSTDFIRRVGSATGTGTGTGTGAGSA